MKLIILFICYLSAELASCLVCDTQLSRDSFACCFYSYGLESNQNCTYNQGECEAGDFWGTDEDLCEEFAGIYSSQNHERIVCKGQKQGNNDTFHWDTNSSSLFQWECSKPGPSPNQATVILKPEPGNVEIASTSFALTVNAENSFPEASSTIKFEDDIARSESKGCSKNTELDGLITSTCTYKIFLGYRNTKFTVVVSQAGFESQAFSYKVSSSAFSSGGLRINGRCNGTLALFCVILLQISLSRNKHVQ